MKKESIVSQDVDLPNEKYEIEDEVEVEVDAESS